jgi:hypothetical protein
MDEKRARLILESYRPGVDDPGDPQFAEALQEIAGNPGLAEWFAEEQAFDRAIAAQLETVPAPFGLKTRILARAVSRVESRPWSWVVKLAAVAALLFLFVQVVSLFRGSAPASAGIQDYAREMVNFVRIDPPLEMESHDLGAIKNWLAKKDAAPMDIPPRLAALQPLGCRILSIRSQKVTLICFRRDGDRLAHLFVIDRTAMPKMKPGEKPVFADAGEWTTASWVENDRVYMIAVRGDRAAVERYLPST